MPKQINDISSQEFIYLFFNMSKYFIEILLTATHKTSVKYSYKEMSISIQNSKKSHRVKSPSG